MGGEARDLRRHGQVEDRGGLAGLGLEALDLAPLKLTS